MSIHIPQVFLHGNGSGHSSNYLVNKHALGAVSARSVNEMKFQFDKDTSNYFYNELSKILNTDTTHQDGISENIIVSNHTDTNADTNADTNICLITKEKLEPNHITLSCNHKFNYMPLYNEVVNQKNKQNNIYEIAKLSSNQIKCPYCRAITNKLLPYIAYPSVKVIKNVNSYVTTSYNNNPDYFLYAPKCSHATINNTKNPCQKYGVYYETGNVILCPQHHKTYVTKQKTDDGGGGSKDKDSTKGVCNTGCCCAILKSGKNMGKICGIRCIGSGDGDGDGDGGGGGANETNTGTNTGMKYCKKHYKLFLT
jgi:hypothetical protein